MKRLLLLLLYTSPVFAQQVLTLEQSKQLALQNNFTVKNSELQVEAAQQTRRAAVTKYFPAVSASGATFKAQNDLFDISTPGGNLPVYDGNPAHLLHPTQFAYFPGMSLGMFKAGTIGMVTAMQPVFAGGRIINGNKLASVGEDVSEYRDVISKNDVLLKTEEQYWTVVSLEEKLKTIVKYEEMLGSLLRQVEDAYKSGIVMKNDVLKVRVKRSEMLLNKSKLENGKKLATMAFCNHIGIPYDSTLVLDDTLNVNDMPQTYYVDKDKALAGRAEYRLLQSSVEAEQLQTCLKLGEYLPEAGIGVSGVYMKFDESDKRTVGLVYGTVSIPISGWWEASHTLQERSLKERIAENNLKDNSNLLLLQMEKAWQDLTDAYKQYLLSLETVEQTQENLKLNEQSYANGLINVSDLLEAQASFQQSLDGLTDAKSNYDVKRTNYLQVTGR